ncbi:diguanylate cyclase [Chitinimonas sp.]|uniref:ligand-binding sensor domain-containing diguanylate cyclase n=1 Tax=Chitinimonas sp. TaxID=1934313 RepID=UPI002F92F5F9
MLFPNVWLSYLRRVFVSLLICVVQSQASQISIQEYGEGSGLSNLAVRALVQDAGGYLWVGTDNGLFRFDGLQFTRFDTTEHLTDVNTMVADGKRLWIAAGGTLWFRESGPLQQVRPAGRGLALIDLPQAIAPDGQHIWAIDDWQLVDLTEKADGTWLRRDVFDAQTRAKHTELSSINSVLRGATGDVWFGCGLAICHLDAGKLDIWREDRGVPQGVWHWLLRARDGSLWARGNHHVIQLEAGHARFTNRTDAHVGDDPSGLYPLVEDAAHRIVSVERTAVIQWDGQRWLRIEDGMPPGGRIRAMLADREGGMWLGQLGGGLLQWRGYGQWENWSLADGLPNAVAWDIARSGLPGKRLYVATGTGLAVFEESTRRFVLQAGTDKQEVVTVTPDAAGTIWAGTGRGRIFHIAHGREAEKPDQIDLPHYAPVIGIYANRAGGVWVLTQEGLFTVKADGHALVAELAAEPSQSNVGELQAGCQDAQGRLLLAGTNGIAARDDRGWQLLYRAAAGIQTLTCLRDGGLVIGGSKGGIQLLRPDGKQLRATDITPAMLNGHLILGLIEDRRGWLWVNSDAGTAVWNRSHWRMLDRSRGLGWNDTSANALDEDNDGTVWIGTSRGLSHMRRPEQLFFPGRATVDIKSVSRGAFLLNTDQPAHLAWSTDPININLAVPTFQNRAALKVEYRLPGFDPSWRTMEHMDLHLTGLPAGSYRFEARVTDTELGTASPIKGFDFILAPPWWQTRLATLAAMFALACLGYGMYRWRIRAHLRQTSKLEALVSLRTQELQASRDSLREMATKDGLTGVWNRRALDEILDREIARSLRGSLPLAIAIVDIDHFKRVNDTHGHQAGDAVLAEFAGRIASSLRPYDSLGRYGGEEFLLIMPGLDVTRPDHRQRLADIHATIPATPMSIGTVTCSIGVVGIGDVMEADARTLIAQADAALYEAKRRGRNRIVWAGSMPPAEQ